jgi:hypothetical protein
VLTTGAGSSFSEITDGLSHRNLLRFVRIENQGIDRFFIKRSNSRQHYYLLIRRVIGDYSMYFDVPYYMSFIACYFSVNAINSPLTNASPESVFILISLKTISFDPPNWRLLERDLIREFSSVR